MSARRAAITVAAAVTLVAGAGMTPAAAGVVPGGCITLTVGSFVHQALGVPDTVAACLPDPSGRSR